MTANRHAVWFRRAIWLGILANLSFAVPALFTPAALTSALGLGGIAPTAETWLRNAGMLLVILSGFHALVAANPLRAIEFSRWAVGGRFVAAAFWAWLVVGVGLPGVLWWFFTADLVLGLACGILLMRALAMTPRSAPKPWRRSLFDRAYGGLVAWMEEHGVLWYHLWPPKLGSLAGSGLRRELRAKNLYASPGDVPDDLKHRVSPDPAHPPSPVPPWDPAYRDSRTPDGSYNDLSDPAMGMVGMRFGRNFPPEETWPVVPPEGAPNYWIPSPRDVSNQLLARPLDLATKEPKMIEATSLNLLAAAWIQFQNHGWFNHRIPKMTVDPQTGHVVPVDPRTGEPVPAAPADFIHVPLDPNDDWVKETGQTEMRVRRTVPDPTRPANASYPPTYRTTDTHWWDASQIYGNNLVELTRLRAGPGGKPAPDGKLPIVEVVNVLGQKETLLPIDPDIKDQDGKRGVDLTGLSDNYWVGTSLLHTLFVREHNYLCDELKKRYANDLAGLPPDQASEWLFGKSRLIVAGLMAKIHTVEWTPGILANRVLRIDMDANWWGVLGRWFKIQFGRVSENEGISGIIGSGADHHAAPYSLTEDFVAVYRLHPLIPDNIQVHELVPTSRTLAPMTFEAIQGVATRDAVLQHGMTNWLYSFGKQHPGAITLRNYPQSLRRFKRLNGEILDLATRDIIRDRERGVPRYNRFRELLRMRPMRSYEELVGHREDRDYLIATLTKLYGNDGIDRVDLLVGLLAEKVPPGFGFSDTAFRIFILMASRRLKSDRFFTDDFRPEVYTPFGIDWLNNETMASLLVRHYPELGRVIPTGRNTFAPW